MAIRNWEAAVKLANIIITASTMFFFFKTCKMYLCHKN